MSSADRSSRGAEPVPPAATPAPGPSTTHNLLEQVLQQTARQAVFDDSPAAESTRRALQAVAERHRGRDFDFDPVAVDLVHAALAGQFALLGSVDRDWRPMSVKIARVLFDDPVACERLRALWTSLGTGRP